MTGSYLVMGCRWGRVVRVERDSVVHAFRAASAMRAEGWAVTVLAELPS